MNLRWFTLIVFGFLPSVLLAQSIEPAQANDPVPKADPKPTVQFTGQFQADALGFAQDSTSLDRFGRFPNGMAFRRARLGLFGDYGPTDYRIDMDFALAGRPSFLDVFAGVRDVPLIGNLRVGHFFEPFSLERLTANRFTTFLERSLLDQAFVPARNLGVMAFDTAFEERLSWELGLFRAGSNVFGDDTGTRYEMAVTGRLTGTPVYLNDGQRLLHLGAAYSFRGPNDGSVEFRAQPESRIGANPVNVPFLIQTGNLKANSYHLLGAELAVVEGAFSAQAEFTWVPVNTRTNGTRFFNGWYVECNYFLTGEHRPYQTSTGTFNRVKPKRDAIGPSGAWTGPGAWQLAARVSQVDLNSGVVSGGRLTDLTLGCNWYLNRFLRVSSNYILSSQESAGLNQALSHGFGLRVGFDF
jgi:phosphate-selective porin OprO and OprP